MRKTKKWLAALLAAALLGQYSGLRRPSSSAALPRAQRAVPLLLPPYPEGSEPSTADVSDAEPGWKQHADEPITLQWYVNYSWFPRKWEGSKATEKYIKDTASMWS